jgi:lipopolysaccharide export system protein LptC
MIPPRTVRGILVIGLLAAVSFWLNREPGGDEQAAIAGLDTRLNYALRDFEGQYFDEQGRLAGQINAPLLTNDAESGVGRIDQPRFRVVHEDMQWTILSATATLTPDRERVHFGGQVSLFGQEPSGREVQILTSEVTLDIDPRVANSADDVTIHEGQNFLAATGFRLDMTNNEYQLFNKVQGQYVLP